MIGMFVNKVAQLFPCHRAKEKMHEYRLCILPVGVNKRNPLFFSRLNIGTWFGYNKFRLGWHIVPYGSIILQHIFQRYFAE